MLGLILYMRISYIARKVSFLSRAYIGRYINVCTIDQGETIKNFYLLPNEQHD